MYSFRKNNQLIKKCVLISFLWFNYKVISQNNINKTDSIITFAKKQLGTKYKYGSAIPENGFDCSGFVYYVFKEFNVAVPRSSKEYYALKHDVNIDSVKAGDVLLFEKPGHVAIVIEKNENQLLFIHSSSDKKHSGVKISNFYVFTSYKKRFVKAIRVL